LKALIIAAGQGIRLRPIGDTKPLVQLLGLGLIERVILTAKKSGIKEFCIVTGYNSEKIRESLSDGKKYGVKIQYVQNDSWTRGNAISILKARDHFKESFVLLMADHNYDHRILNELLKTKIEKDITKKFPDVEWHPEQFPGAVFRLKNPKATTLLFSTGKMVCTGSKSEDMARKAVKTVVQRLRKGGIKVKKDATVTIQNIVASINLGGKIHLEQAARTLPRCMYEPEQFPGVIHRIIDPKTVILIFASGKLVCTGGKTEKDVYRSVNNLHSMLEEKNLMVYD